MLDHAAPDNLNRPHNILALVSFKITVAIRIYHRLKGPNAW